MESETPRTNKNAFAHYEGFCVSIAFARELERELNESNRLKNLALSRMDDALEKAESLSTPDCHICHNKCQRPLCILSKQLAASRAEVERLTDHLEIKNNKIKALELSLKTFSNWSVTIKQNLLCDPDFIRITKEVLNEDHENEEKLDILREKIK